MKYSIYIPTRGRFDKLYTADYFANNGLNFSLVVEKKEADLYREKYPNNVIELPGSDYGSVYFARNFIKKMSIEKGEKRHWQIDDDIKKLMHIHNGEFLDMPPGNILENMENFCDKFKNVGLASPHSSVWVKFGKKPFDVNKLAHGCCLINNDLDIWWNKGLMGDVDYNLQVLESGLCTVRFYIYSFSMSPRTSRKGGGTDAYLNKERQYKIVKDTQEKWGLGRITEKTVSGNTLYTVQFTNKLREYNQKLIVNFDESYLKRAREVTQEFIMEYGGNLAHIDKLDEMIAKAIEKEINNWLDELYEHK